MIELIFFSSFDESHDSLLHLLRSKVEQSRRGRNIDSRLAYEDTRPSLDAPRRWSSPWNIKRTRTIPDIEPDVDNVPPPPMVLTETQPVLEVIKENANDESNNAEKKRNQKIQKLENPSLMLVKNTTPAVIAMTLTGSKSTLTTTSIPSINSTTLVASTTTTLMPTISLTTSTPITAANLLTTTTTVAPTILAVTSMDSIVTSTTTSTFLPEPQAAALEGVGDVENSDDNRILRKAFLEFLANKMNATSPVAEWSTDSELPQSEAGNINEGQQQQSSTTTEDPTNIPELDDSVIETLTLEELEQILQINNPSTTTTTTTQPTNQQTWPMSPDTSKVRWDVPREAKYDLSTSESRINQLLRQVTKGSHQSGGSSGYEDEEDIECGGFLNITTFADLSSPSYPSRYPPNIDCRWVITAPSDQILRVKIHKLVIEHDSSCRFDYLDIKGLILLCLFIYILKFGFFRHPNDR